MEKKSKDKKIMGRKKRRCAQRRKAVICYNKTIVGIMIK